MRILIFTLLFVGILLYIASLSYNKVVSLALARSSINYLHNSSKEKESEIMMINNCDGKFSFSPRNIQITNSGQVHLINSDATPHTIGFAYTRFWESIPPGGSLVVDMDYLKESGSVAVTCDGLLLENPPTIARRDLE